MDKLSRETDADSRPAIFLSGLKTSAREIFAAWTTVRLSSGRKPLSWSAVSRHEVSRSMQVGG
jgi:hypothetical protein